ncbi:hypothetical protein H2O14_01810 [Rhizobium sp. G21]|nr:hypothetical protein [Rhizobium sp. G21]MBB1247669.1 hypothetical protein [Rhizobium sp. G21]
MTASACRSNRTVPVLSSISRISFAFVSSGAAWTTPKPVIEKRSQRTEIARLA